LVRRERCGQPGQRRSPHPVGEASQPTFKVIDPSLNVVDTTPGHLSDVTGAPRRAVEDLWLASG
jgi:hypothetical protein